MLSYIISTVNDLKIVLKTLAILVIVVIVRIADSMRAGPGIFGRGCVWGVGVQVNNLFYRRPMVYFKGNHNFPNLGVQHFPGGSNFYRGRGGEGFNCVVV